MSFFKRFRRKKHSTGSTQSTSKIISDSGSFIDDFPVANSFPVMETRSNNESSWLVKKPPGNMLEPTRLQLTPPAPLSSYPSSSPRTRRSNQASIEVLRDKLEKLSGVVDPTLSVRSVMESSRTVAPEKNSFESELRFLDTKIRGWITNELDANKAWKALAGKLNHPDRPCDPLFTDIQVLNDEKKVKSPSEEILKTWSTTGRNRPRIQDLYDVLVDILQLKIAQRLMNEVQGTAVSLCLGADSEQTNMLANGCSNSNGDAVQFRDMKACLSEVYQICFDVVDTKTDHFSPSSRAKIGEGNFGIVYRVEYNGEDLAVKLFKEDINQIANEIEQLSALKHPNVLSLYGIAVGENSVCMITRYMSKGSLQQMLASTVLDWPLRLRILRDVAAGLEYVHSLKVQHRDIKPANILLDENMNALLADFGLARKKQSFGTSKTEITAGSPYYWAPEVPRGIVALASDVYSFGVVALEMFTGLPVFDSNRTHDMLTDHIVDKTPDEVCDTRIPQPSETIKEECFRDITLCLRRRTERPDMKYIHQQFRMFFEYICDEESAEIEN